MLLTNDITTPFKIGFNAFNRGFSPELQIDKEALRKSGFSCITALYLAYDYQAGWLTGYSLYKKFLKDQMNDNNTD